MRVIVAGTLGVYASDHRWDESRFDPKIAVRALISSLEDSNPPVVGLALNALGNFGDAARDAAPRLLKALHDTDNGVRGEALLAFKSVARDLFMDAVAGCLEDSNSNVLRDAIEILRAFGSEAHSAISSLLSALQDPDFFEVEGNKCAGEDFAGSLA